VQDRDIDELQRIWDLKEKGAISEEEYARLKSRILDQQTAASRGSSSTQQTTQSAPVADAPVPAPSYKNLAGVGCLAILGLFFAVALFGPTANQNSSSVANATDPNVETNLSATDMNATGAESQGSETTTTRWSYSEDEDKVRGGTTYYASTTSTNSIAQEAPYDSDTTMRMAVRKSPAFGTDVILTISSGQMMCPSYEGCSGTVRFDNGPAQHIRFNGPADDSSDTVFVTGAKSFIAKLRSAKKVTIEKTLYQAGNPQFEFDVRGFKWNH
jgi:hypothetical protein